mmetsp:Transcript_10982/g.29484  ORF Transcript_10982/g.29484 Transcript_10982/m.29484 type:complete len:140 (-) Transcript_10982:537-956(-)
MGAMVEIPAHFVMYVSANTIGRRRSEAMFATSFALCAALVFFAPSLLIPAQFRSALALTARMSALAAANLMYIIAAESFPSHCRNIGMNVGAMAAHLGALIAPALMDSTVYALVWVAALTLTVAVAIFQLDETLGQRLA